MANQDYVDRYRVAGGSEQPTKTVQTDNRYKVNIKKYPSDLESPDLKHFILFNINARGKSKLDESKRLFEVKRDPNSANLTNDQLSTATLAGAGLATAAAVGTAVTSLVSNATKAVGKTGATSVATRAQSLAKKVAPGAVGTAAGIGAGAITAKAISSNELLKKDTTYRISDAVALYVDGPPTVKYGMNYANKDLGTLLGMLSGSALNSTASAAASEIGAAMGATVAKLPGAFGGGDLAAAMGKSAGTSLNPFKEVVFESVDFRSFSFKYKFLPKSKAESEAVRDIVMLFKEHMHPQLSSGKLFFIYPSEFQITYYFEDKENTYFHKFRPCALESMDVTYGGDQFSSFRDGNPTEVNMTLTFRELEILTRQNIREGY